MATYYILINNQDNSLTETNIINEISLNDTVTSILPNNVNNMFFANVELSDLNNLNLLSFADKISLTFDDTQRLEVRMLLETPEWDYPGGGGLLMKTGYAS